MQGSSKAAGDGYHADDPHPQQRAVAAAVTVTVCAAAWHSVAASDTPTTREPKNLHACLAPCPFARQKPGFFDALVPLLVQGLV
jgi:hypothetical protein